MSSNTMLMKFQAETGQFLYDGAKMQIYRGNDVSNPLISGKTNRPIATDYAKATINVVKGCNLSCQYCPYGSGSESKTLELMPPDVGRSIVDYLAKAFPPNVQLVKISFTSNGEPALNLKVIRAIKQRAQELLSVDSTLPHFKFNFATNSIAISRDDLTEQALSSDQEVFFSVDGYPELHNQIRTLCNGKGTYEQVAATVNLYKELIQPSSKKLTSSTVLTALNDRYDLILLHLVEMGFESIVTRPIRGANDTPLGLNHQTVDLFISGYKKMIDLLEEDAMNGNGDLLQKVCNRYDFFGRLFSALILGEERQQGCPGCPPGYNDIANYSLVFDINGDVYFPCRDFIGEADYCLGNIYTGVDVEKARSTMEPVRAETRPYCSECWANSLCGGGCYNAAFLSTGQIREPDRNLCHVILYVVERAVKLAYALAIQKPEMLENLVRVARRSSPWYRQNGM